MNNPVVKAERPDKPLFFAMMGVFLLLLSIAPAYWASYNYGEADRTNELLRRWSQQPEIVPKDSYSENPFDFQKSKLQRYKFEMALSGFGSFVLFGVALLLFIKSFKSRNKKNLYHEINWRMRPMPTAKIEVTYTNFQTILLVGLSLFFVLMSILLFYQTLTSQFSTTREIIVKGAFCLLLLGLVLLLISLAIRARRQAVKMFDASGVTRGDGKHFYWAEFCGVVTQTARNRFGRTYVWRKELAFSNGETAWIIPQRIKNSNEVFEYLNKLPSAVLKEVK